MCTFVDDLMKDQNLLCQENIHKCSALFLFLLFGITAGLIFVIVKGSVMKILLRTVATNGVLVGTPDCQKVIVLSSNEVEIELRLGLELLSIAQWCLSGLVDLLWISWTIFCSNPE